MTTKTEITKSHQAVQVPLQIKTSIWPLVLAGLLILSLISAAILVLPPKGEDFSGNRSVLEANSARYQGMADLHTGGSEVGAQQALEILSARYQSLADLYIAGHEARQRALEIMSLRYQGMAEFHGSGSAVGSQRALQSISARYQTLADLYIAGNETRQRALESLSLRYQAMADLFITRRQD